ETADGEEATALDRSQGTEVEFGAGSVADPEQAGPRSTAPAAGKAHREDVIPETRPAHREEPGRAHECLGVGPIDGDARGRGGPFQVPASQEGSRERYTIFAADGE